MMSIKFLEFLLLMTELLQNAKNLPEIYKLWNFFKIIVTNLTNFAKKNI